MVAVGATPMAAAPPSSTRPPPRPPRHGIGGLTAALYYISVSCALTVCNKLLFHAAPALRPHTLLLAQSLTSLCVLSLLARTRFYTAPRPPPRNLYLPLLIAYLSMLGTSLLALRLTSLLMYNAVRRTSILFVTVLAAVQARSWPRAPAVAATMLTIAGAAAAAQRDLGFQPAGYALAVAANAATAAYVVLLRPTRDALSLSNAQLMHLNCAGATPLLLGVQLVAGSGAVEWDVRSFFYLAASCVLAVVISHATAVNTVRNDAVAHTLHAQVKDVVLLLASLLVVDDPRARAPGNITGVLFGFSGSVVYALGKLRESREAQNAKNKEVIEKVPVAEKTA